MLRLQQRLKDLGYYTGSVTGNYGKLTETEAAIAELEAALNVNWPDPTYKEMETTPEDTAEGTLQYTVSEDGTTVTISYTVNGNTISHTVPNNDNYLFGGYGATDDLGRSMFDSSEVGGYGEEKERYVGLFYFLCQGEHGDKPGKDFIMDFVSDPKPELEIKSGGNHFIIAE